MIDINDLIEDIKEEEYEVTVSDCDCDCDEEDCDKGGCCKNQ